MDDFQGSPACFVLPPQTRMLALVGSLGPPTPGNDLGGYGIYVQLQPVVAGRTPGNGMTDECEPLFVHDGRLVSPSQLDHRTQVSTFRSPWPDTAQEFLHDKINAMRLRMRLHAEYLRECGEPIYHVRRAAPAWKPAYGFTLIGIGVVLAALAVVAGKHSSQS